MTLSAFAAARRDAAAPTVQQSIARRAHSSKPAARCCRGQMGQTNGQTDRRTPYRYTDPAPHTMRPLPILCGEPADSPTLGCSPVCFEFFGVIQHKENFFLLSKNKKTVIKNNRTSVRAARRVGRRVGLTIDSRSARSHVLCSDSGQVVHTVVPLSPSGMIWTVTLCSCAVKPSVRSASKWPCLQIL